jgi:hypothetical protein
VTNRQRANIGESSFLQLDKDLQILLVELQIRANTALPPPKQAQPRNTFMSY